MEQADSFSNQSLTFLKMPPPPLPPGTHGLSGLVAVTRAASGHAPGLPASPPAVCRRGSRPALTHRGDAEAPGRPQGSAPPRIPQHLHAGLGRSHQQHPALQPAEEGQPRGGARQPCVPEAARVGPAEGAEQRAAARLPRRLPGFPRAQHQGQRAGRQLHRRRHTVRPRDPRSLRPRPLPREPAAGGGAGGGARLPRASPLSLPGPRSNQKSPGHRPPAGRRGPRSRVGGDPGLSLRSAPDLSGQFSGFSGLRSSSRSRVL